MMTTISPFIFFKMAALSLSRHPIRSILALLGIVIGIASMTITMALGEGANEQLKKEILAMGENWIYIMPGNFLSRGEVRKNRKIERNLSYEDYLAIRQFSADIQACTPCMETKEVAKYQGNQLVAEIQGLNADYFRIEPRGIKMGMPFSNHHESSAIPVAVLGSGVAQELFKKENPIGKTILIGKNGFKVIGVFNEAPKKVNRIQNPNLNIVVPFSTVWKKMISPEKNNSIHRLIIRPIASRNSTQLVASIRRLLRFRHQLYDQQPDDFTIWDLQVMMQAAHKSSQVFNQFLLIAASVSLIVGGIGIMNIMLVAMTERRKEIGIKMALGATSGHILSQFLVESVLLCLTGGVMGILCGLGGTYLVGLLTEFNWAIRGTPLAIAFVTTLIVGLFFGFYPAYKASKLNPIEALQSI
jgi:putative ABC transport system permease protein